MNIAVLGWGSLVWCPGQLRIKSAWHNNGPRLEVEFARISKDGRLTLVIHPGSGEQQTYWAVSECEDVTAAIENLADREGCNKNKIGVEQRDHASTEARIRDWLKLKPDVDAAVWTNHRSNWTDKRGKEFSCEEARLYIRELGRQKRARAEQYVRNTPVQIQTKLRERLRNELGWSDNELSKILFVSDLIGSRLAAI
jgi:hypothetical protein